MTAGFIWVFTALSLLSFSAQGAIVLDSVTGYSTLDTTNAAKPIIYGGLAGPSTNCTGTDVCNSCSQTIGACNERRIHSNLNLVITFHSDGLAGQATLEQSSGDNISLTIPGTTTASVGGSVSIEISWSSLCLALDTNASTFCATNFTKDIKVGIDNNNDGEPEETLSIGIVVHDPNVADPGNSDQVADCNSSPTGGLCGVTFYPGDEKAFLEDLSPAGSFPNSTGIRFSHLVVYYSTNGFSDVTPLSEGRQDLSIDEDSEGFFLGDDAVSGLDNDQKYFFRVAGLDKAGNIAYITSDNNILANCGGSSIDQVTDELTCPYIATPSKVFGVLREDWNCFISTAAFGSSLAPEVQLFRQFRNRILLPHAWGQNLVLLYYKWGPYGARWINNKPWARALTRGALWPLWGWAWLSLKIGPLPTTLLSLILLMFSLWMRPWKWIPRLVSAISKGPTQ